jgi:hypothetical protein
MPRMFNIASPPGQRLLTHLQDHCQNHTPDPRQSTVAIGRCRTRADRTHRNPRQAGQRQEVHIAQDAEDRLVD